MRKFLFVIASALIAGATYCTNATSSFVSVITHSNQTEISQQNNQPLILEQAPSDQLLASNGHYSHGSHGSHGSHTSHYSGR